MIVKRIATTSILAALVLSPARPVLAGDGLVGGIVGGIIGGVIVNEATKNQRARPVVRNTYSPSLSSADRAANREAQVSLNYFGFPVGTPDGVMGARSQAEISEYQTTLGYAPTGQLTDYERNLLVSSYYRAVAGGAATQQAAAQNPMGMRGLLIGYRDEMAGGQPAATPSAATTEATAQQAPAPAPQTAPVTTAAATSLPNFLGGDTTQASLASHCNKVSLLTNSNGGFTTAATMKDANFALNEQFCLARTYAISEGEDMAAKIQGFTPQQIAQQCEGFGPSMKEYVAALSVKPRDDVLRDVSGFALASGMAPAQLAQTAKICLSVGYRTDNLDVAISSALLLTVLGDKVYAELIGHHLAEGFGTSQRPDLAIDWYQMSLDALKAGSTPVFVPGQTDRADLIRKAAYTVAGKPDQATTTVVPTALPSFAAPGTATATTPAP